MDMEGEADRWKAYVEQLVALPFVRSARVRRHPDNDRNYDAVLSFETPNKRRHELRVELKDRPLHGGAAQELLRKLQRLPANQPLSRWMVWAPYIDPIAGKLFAEAGLHYVDLHGNCHVALGDQYFTHVERPGAPAKPAAAKAWRPASYRILFALLARTDLITVTTRELAAHAGGVSPQTVADVRAKLRERGILLEARGKLHWAPDGYRHALDLWTHGFTTMLQPSLHLGRFRAKERDPHRLEALLEPVFDQFGRWGWGGGAACERLTQFYRGEKTVVYLNDRPGVTSRFGHLVPDAQGPVSVLMSPGPLAFPDTGNHVVHPVLAYADLLAEAEPRAGEAAAEIYAQFLGANAEKTS